MDAREDGRVPATPRRCPDCDGPMRSAGGEQMVDRWVERLVCEACGREVYRGSGRGGI